jgi:hypothetical protein
MKYLFLPMLLFITNSLFAQNFLLGINGGLMHDAVHNTTQGSIIEDADKFQDHVISPDVSIKAMYVHNHYQYGIAVDYRTLSYKINYIDEIWGQAEFIKLQFKDQDIPLKLFINRTIQLNHVELYGGISLGYVFISETFGSTVQHPNSAVGDLHIGVTYFVTKKVGINLELAGEYINYPPLNQEDHSFPPYLGCNVLDKGSLSAAIGVRYRL